MKHFKPNPRISIPNGAICRCHQCDATRLSADVSALVWCDDCEEQTPSYIDDSACDAIDAMMHAAFNRFTFDEARSLAPVVRHGNGVVA